MYKESRVDTHKVYPVEDVPQFVLDELTFENPTYWKNKRMNLSTKNIPTHYKLYEEKDGFIYLPRAIDINLPIDHDFRVDGIKMDMKFNGQLRDYQVEPVKILTETESGILQAGTGRGKGHTLDTIIYTPEGKKLFGDLKKGDKVIGSDGGPITVTDIYERGVIPTYKITLNDGTSILCDGEHLFTVQTAKHKSRKIDKWQTLQVKDLIDDLHYADGRKKWYLPVVKPVQFLEKDVPLDPYLLGTLIADGTLREEGMISFSNNEPDIITRISSFFSLTPIEGSDYNLSGGYKLKPSLKDLGLLGKRSYEKFIPEIYKYNSIDIRLEILRGLFDCDGSVEEGSRLIYNTSSKKLAHDVLEIVQSLGGVGRITCKKEPKYTYNSETRIGRPAYRVSIILDNMLPFTSNKHSEKFVGRTKYFAVRSIQSIEYVGEKEIRCIAVDAEDKLYVAENFIVTHNTNMCLVAMANVGVTTLILVHKEFLMNQWVDRIKEFFDYDAGIVRGDKWDWQGKKVVVGMLQTIYSRRDRLPDGFLNYFGTIAVDECHRVASDTFSHVIQMFPAKRRWGLTATTKRTDGMENVFFAHLGPVVVKVKGVSAKPRIVKIGMKYDFDIKPYRNRWGAQDVNISRLVTAVCELPERNDFIMNMIMKAAERGRKIIVFSERVAHLEQLNEQFNFIMNPEGYTSGLFIGKMKQEDRDIVSETCDVLFATYQIAKEGLDIPELDTCVLASPVSNQITIEQGIGRITREHEGKKDPLVLDFIDESIDIFQRMFYKRAGIYKKLDYPVVT